MKSKNKTKALAFLNKYQLGGEFDPYSQNNPYDYYPNLESAQQGIDTPLPSLSAPKPLTPYQPTQENKPDFLDKAIPFVSPAINLGLGIANLFQANKLKKRQRAYEKAFQKDLRQRQEESRVNDYYYTPYGFQEGGQIQSFIDFYQDMEDKDQMIQSQFQDYYDDKNQQMIQNWKSKKAAGFQNLFSGVEGALSLFQKGGLKYDKGESMALDTLRKKREMRLSNKTPDYVPPKLPKQTNYGSGKSKSKERFREMQEGGDPTQDIYSKEFQYELPEEIKTEIDQAAINDQIDQTLMDWIFEEPPEYNYEQEVDDQTYPQGKIYPVVEYLKSMGLNPSSIDTGQHNPGSKHYSGHAVDLGLNTTFGGDIKKMYQFKQWFETKGNQMFPGLTLRDETSRPKGQQVWSGSHLHLEY